MEKKIKYKIISDRVKPSKTLAVNHVDIHGSTMNECLHVLLYNPDVINYVAEIIDKHNPEEIVFNLVDTNCPPLVYVRENFKEKLLMPWMDSMVEAEEYEAADRIKKMKLFIDS